MAECFLLGSSIFYSLCVLCLQTAFSMCVVVRLVNVSGDRGFPGDFEPLDFREWALLGCCCSSGDASPTGNG